MERLNEKVVWLPSGQNTRLAEAMGVTNVTASRAMNGLNTDLGRRLRDAACREFGGRVVVWDLPAMCQEVGVMIHDHATGRRIVALGKGFYLVTYILDNPIVDCYCVVQMECRDGIVRQWDTKEMTIERYMEVQDEAVEFVASLKR